MIPEKLNFVEKKNEKNTEISEKIRNFYGISTKTVNFQVKYPSLSKGALAIPPEDHPLPQRHQKTIYRCREHNDTHFSPRDPHVLLHRDGYEKPYVQSSCLYHVEVRREFLK